MKIENDKVVQFHYRLREDGSDEELESSFGGEPTAYLHGHRNIIVGLEEKMTGHEQGDTFSATVPAAKAYGLRREDQQQRVPIKHLHVKKNTRLKPGMIVQVQTEHGPRQVTVVKAGKFNVDVDTNHPLAGKDLTFDIEIVDVRDASDEEVAHGHAHGVGGHHH